MESLLTIITDNSAWNTALCNRLFDFETIYAEEWNVTWPYSYLGEAHRRVVDLLAYGEDASSGSR